MRKFSKIILDCSHEYGDIYQFRKSEDGEKTYALISALNAKFEGLDNSLVNSGDIIENSLYRDKIAKLESMSNQDTLVLSFSMNYEDCLDIIYSLKDSDITFPSCVFSTPSRIYQKALPQNQDIDFYWLQRELECTVLMIKYPKSWVDKEYRDASIPLFEKMISYYLGYDDCYVVQRGDSLFSIAKQYHMDVEQLKGMNHLVDNKVSIGERLRVYSERCGNEPDKIYCAKKGENVYVIARKYGIDSHQLMDYNDLTNAFLEHERRLRIPSVGKIEYQVDGNENLYNVAKKCETTKEKLLIENGLTDGFLMFGQKISI